jgi:hypothetical protein
MAYHPLPQFARLATKFKDLLREGGLKSALRASRRFFLFRTGFGSPVEKRRIQLSKNLDRALSSTVKYGPFKGLKFSDDSRWNGADRCSMLLGFYELEVLNAIVALQKAGKFRAFIDVGAADGYYGVGVLVGNLFERSFCFEISEVGQRLIKAHAALNGVDDRISVFGRATKEFGQMVEQEYRECSVVLFDIEGAEFEILDRDVFRAYQHSAFIVEIHDWIADSAAKIQKLKEDAAEFFEITELKTSARDMSSYEEIRAYSDTDRWLMCSEGRPRLMSWCVLLPKALGREIWQKPNA